MTARAVDAAVQPVDPGLRERGRDLIDRLRRIPDDARRLVVCTDRAEREFQVSAELLAALRADGLPARRAGDDWRYDPNDLLNVALHLDIGSRHRKVLAWWARELARPYGTAVQYGMDYPLRCPSPGHPGRCRYRVLAGDDRRIELIRASGATYSVMFELRRSWPELPMRYRELVDELAAVRFMRLPDPLRRDIDFVRASGLGDCRGTAWLLAERATERGLVARTCYGRSLTPPFSAAHHWAEFRVDDRWVPVDPVLIDAFVEWGLFTRDSWNRYDSLGAILGRLADRWQPLVTHNGEALELEPRTYRVVSAAAAGASR